MLQIAIEVFPNIIIIMQGQEGIDKLPNSCKLKEKVFNVRRLNRLEPEDRKLPLPQQGSPAHERGTNKIYGEKANKNSCQPTNKQNEYYLKDTILNSEAYKELTKKYNQMKYQQAIQKERMMKAVRQKSEALKKATQQKERLTKEKERLTSITQEMKDRLDEIRYRNQRIRYNMEQQNNMMSAEYFRNMLLSLRYQNQLMQYDINPDNMTYQELLQLEQRMGNVSKGLTPEQIAQIPKFKYAESKQDQLCPICYYDIKKEEQVYKFNCGHLFHSDCMVEWLQKEKICPMCKQEIVGTTSTANSNIKNESQEVIANQ